MPEQCYSKHAKFSPPFHFVLAPFLLLIFLGSLVNLYKSLGNHSRLYSASLITAMSVAMILMTLLLRIFPLKAQDRVIRAEENLRHYVLTGRLLDPRLTMQQIIGLRFASDAEFPELARLAAEQSLPPGEIKKAVKQWRPDHDRL